jgi:hypothetical protein
LQALLVSLSNKISDGRYRLKFPGERRILYSSGSLSTSETTNLRLLSRLTVYIIQELRWQAMSPANALLRLTRTRAEFQQTSMRTSLTTPPASFNLFHANRFKLFRSVRVVQLYHGSNKRNVTSPSSRAETNILNPIPPSPRPEVAKVVGYLCRCASRPSYKRNRL